MLVSEQDGEPVVKVIDFGVAKALNRANSDNSVYSGLFQAIGTLPYMSPEQAGLSVSDIDTRADIYSLGVLLYELITGDTPFDKKHLASAALAEAFRIIREVDPPKPSTRTHANDNKIASISQFRKTDQRGLYRIVRGELDWIVMKCLDKNRKMRYETPSALSDDIARFLKNEEVHARPPSALYRLSKTLRRHRVAALILLLAIALLVTASALGWVGYLNLAALRELDLQSRIPQLIDSAKQRQAESDYSESAKRYEELLRLEQETATASDLAIHKSQYAFVLGKLDQLSDAQRFFIDASNDLERISDNGARRRAALTVGESLISCVEALLAGKSFQSRDTSFALAMSDLACILSDKYDFEQKRSALACRARIQYATGQFDQAGSNCIRWLSADTTHDAYLAYILLAAASARMGNAELARDWWLVADNYWIGASLRDLSQFQDKRREFEGVVRSVVSDIPSHLSVAEEERLYARMLTRYPRLYEVRKYRAYCLTQLGRWRDAREEFRQILLQAARHQSYVIASGTLFDLFYGAEALRPAQVEKIKEHAFEFSDSYQTSAVAISAMLWDRDGQLADERLLWHVDDSQVACGLVLYRLGRLDESYRVLATHNGEYPPRDALSAIIRALIDWERGEKSNAQQNLARAEELIERLGPREDVARTNEDVGFATSVSWLEPLLLLREAREKIPRQPGEGPHPVDSSLYPR